jgi:small-conductance mechanosensitive channel
MEDINVIESLIATGVAVSVAAVLYFVALRFGRRVLRRVEQRGPETAERANTLWLMARRLILVAVVVTTALALLQIWGVGLAPFLAVGTAVAAAIGFGAQDLVKDLIAGFFILIEDQFRVGDVVDIAGATGAVQDIQLRVTVLRDLEGNVHYVPNGQIQVSTNYTSLFAQPIIDIGVAYDTDVDRALEIMRDELESLIADVFGVQELAESQITLRMRLTTTANDRWTVRREALRRIKKRFEGEGITIPFPQLTIHQRS